MTTLQREDSPEEEIPRTAVSPENSPNARLLEERSLEIINCVNSRTFETLYKYAHPGFVDSRPVGTGQMSHHNSVDAVRFMQKHSNHYPDYQVTPLSTLVDINEEDKYGTVWINILRTGGPNGTRMENVDRFRWRQTKDGWVCIKHTVLNAMPLMVGV